MEPGAGRVLRPPRSRRSVLLTTFHLVRHAAHGLLGRRLTGRMPGVPLSEAGQAQAARLAEAFSGADIAAVAASPMQRAQETAAPIAARLGRPVETDPGLDELDFGQWTGATFADLDGRPDWDAWNQARSIAPCPGGESMVQAQARALASLQRWRDRVPDGAVILVSHQDVLKSVLAHVLGVPLDLFHRITIDPASRSVVVLTGTAVRIDAVNLPI